MWLIKTLKKYVPTSHYLVTIVKKPKYKDALEKLTALRNFATHKSKQSKLVALTAVGGQRVRSAGSWLKVQKRFGVLSRKLRELGQEIRDNAPY